MSVMDQPCARNWQRKQFIYRHFSDTVLAILKSLKPACTLPLYIMYMCQYSSSVNMNKTEFFQKINAQVHVLIFNIALNSRVILHKTMSVFTQCTISKLSKSSVFFFTPKKLTLPHTIPFSEKKKYHEFVICKNVHILNTKSFI
jgi:hypothetical protein